MVLIDIYRHFINKYRQSSTNIAIYRQISPNIAKYRHLLTNIDKYRQISKFIDSYRHTLSKRLGGQHLGEKNMPPRKPRWKTREPIPRPNMSCSFFFFLVSWLNSFLGQKFQMRRGAQTGGMKKFWEFFFQFFKKVWKYFNSENYAKNIFSIFPSIYTSSQSFQLVMLGAKWRYTNMMIVNFNPP